MTFSEEYREYARKGNRWCLRWEKGSNSGSIEAFHADGGGSVLDFSHSQDLFFAFFASKSEAMYKLLHGIKDYNQPYHGQTTKAHLFDAIMSSVRDLLSDMDEEYRAYQNGAAFVFRKEDA